MSAPLDAEVKIREPRDLLPGTARSPTLDMKLEVAVIPVSDVDWTKRFYESLGWRLDADFVGTDGSRAVQLTPPGSPASIQLGTGRGLPLYLIVSDIEAARADLVDRGVEVSEVFHRGAGRDSRLSGPDHPGEEIIYVLEGSLEYQVEGKTPVTLKAGDALFVPAGTIHAAKNVGSGNAAELATYVAEQDKPLLTLESKR